MESAPTAPAKRSRVLFVIYSLCGGGAQRVLADTVNALAADGEFEVALRALFHDETYGARLAPGVDYRAAFCLRPGPLQKLVSGLVQYAVPPGLVYRLFFAGEYDTEIAFMEAFPTKLLAHSANRRAKKLAWVHIDPLAYTEQDRLFCSLTQQARCYRQFDAICCVSEGVRSAFVQKFGLRERTRVAYNPIDEADIRARGAQRSSLPLPAGRPLLVSAGSLIPRKGYDRLIRICARLKREGFAFCLLILGEGPQRSELEALARKSGMADEVRLPGYLADPLPCIAAADLYVCSSYAEGFSTAASEALILGVPVAAAGCAGMRELLGAGEYGLLTANEEQALYAGLRSLLEQPALLAHYRQKAAQRGAQFSMQAQLRAYKELLRG